MANKLLNIDQNFKTAKGQAFGYMTGILHLASSIESGYNTCAFASAGCAAACLFRSGNSLMFKCVNADRIAKTKLLFEHRAEFMAQLEKDIEGGLRKAEREDKEFVVRLNGTSDLLVETWGLMEKFPNTKFYDYTKNPIRMNKFMAGKMPKNYHLTFSLSETNKVLVQGVMAGGGNVAMVFRTRDKEKLPKTYMGKKVISGDKNDLRFLDPKGVIVGLTMKGRAQRDTSGFIQPLIEERVLVAA